MTKLHNHTLKDLLKYVRKRGVIDDYEIDGRVNIRIGSLDATFDKDQAWEFVRDVIEEYEQARGGDGGRRRWS